MVSRSDGCGKRIVVLQAANDWEFISPQKSSEGAADSVRSPGLNIGGCALHGRLQLMRHCGSGEGLDLHLESARTRVTEDRMNLPAFTAKITRNTRCHQTWYYLSH